MKFNKSLILFILFFNQILLIYFIPDSISTTENQIEKIFIPKSFCFKEYATKTDNEKGINQIAIQLPSSSWNITNLQINFTNIKLGKEILNVETEPSDSVLLDKSPNGYAVEINLTEPTIIYGVEIYAQMITPADANLYVQINGYDDINEYPNSTRYCFTLLNISTNLAWYYQDFSGGISLPKGKYFLVLNGSEMAPNDPGKYNWYYNADNPSNPNYHSCSYSYSSGWTPLGTGRPFLYKLHQKVDRVYNPEDLSMNATINGESFKVYNGLIAGSGNLTIDNVNFHLGASQFNIPIRINRSIELSFDINYSISIKNKFYSDIELRIPVNGDNEWMIYPQIQRYYKNYSISFIVPDDWQSIKIYKNDVDITSSIPKIGNTYIIPNNTITTGAIWKITTISAQKDIGLKIPKDTFEPEEELKIEVAPPEISGNVTFILIDAYDTEELKEIKEVKEDKVLFSYNFGEKPYEGKWKIFIFWYDENSAGCQSAEISVEVPFSIPVEIIYASIATICILAIVGVSTYTTVKRIKRKKEARKKRIFNKYMDALNLSQIIVTEKKSNLDIFERNFGAREIDATLISGFLEAIRKFGLELTSSEEQTQTIKLDFKGFRVLMTEYKHLRIITVMTEPPSDLFINSINELARDIENTYYNELEKFKGDRSIFLGIQQLLEKHLLISLIYPLKITDENIKISPAEKSMINRARQLMKQKGTDYFFVSGLIAQKKGFQIDDAEIILHLIDKKIFQPIYLE